MENAKPDLEEMATTVISLFPKEFITLSPEEQRVSVQLYRLLADGEPVPRERMATTLNFSNEVVNNILNRWPGIYYDDDDNIVGYRGLALPKMAHRFEVNGRTLYTWCAWDALFIPEIIKKTARVESSCPVTGAKIRLTVAPDGVKLLDPGGAVMSFVMPDAAKIRDNVILNFCQYVFFFSSAGAGAKWVSEHEGTFILSIDDAYYLGRKKNKAQYKDVLKS